MTRAAAPLRRRHALRATSGKSSQQRLNEGARKLRSTGCDEVNFREVICGVVPVAYGPIVTARGLQTLPVGTPALAGGEPQRREKSVKSGRNDRKQPSLARGAADPAVSNHGRQQCRGPWPSGDWIKRGSRPLRVLPDRHTPQGQTERSSSAPSAEPSSSTLRQTWNLSSWRRLTPRRGVAVRRTAPASPQPRSRAIFCQRFAMTYLRQE